MLRLRRGFESRRNWGMLDDGEEGWSGKMAYLLELFFFKPRARPTARAIIRAMMRPSMIATRFHPPLLAICLWFRSALNFSLSDHMLYEYPDESCDWSSLLSLGASPNVAGNPLLRTEAR